MKPKFEIPPFLHPDYSKFNNYEEISNYIFEGNHQVWEVYWIFDKLELNFPQYLEKLKSDKDYYFNHFIPLRQFEIYENEIDSLKTKSEKLKSINEVILVHKRSRLIIEVGEPTSYESHQDVAHNNLLKLLNHLKEMVEALSDDFPEQSLFDNRKVRDQSLKIRVLHDLGIIKYLRQLIVLNGGKLKLSEIVSFITGERESSIRSRLSDPEDNKINTDNINERLTDKLEQWGFNTNYIQLPKV